MDDIPSLVAELRVIGCHENGDARCTCGIGMDAADALEAQAELVGKLRGGRLAMLGHETHQAADTIEAQAAELARLAALRTAQDKALDSWGQRALAGEGENKRLREALQDIMADRPSEKHNGNRNDLIAWQMWRRARAALTHPTGDTGA